MEVYFSSDNHQRISRGFSSNVTGWWWSHPSEKYANVSWDDEIPNKNGTVIQNSMVPVTTNQIINPFFSTYDPIIKPYSIHQPNHQC
jgi:hypothetical protein